MTNASSGATFVFAIGANNVAELTSASVEINGKEIDVTSNDSDAFEEYIMGKVNVKMDVAGNFYPGDTNGQRALLNAALARTKLTSCKLSKASGSFNISGDAYVTNFKWSAKHDDKQDFTCTLRVTGTATAADS